MVCLDGQGFERDLMVEKLVIIKFGGKVYAKTAQKMGTKHEDICVSHFYQKVISAEEDFNNQVGKRTCSVNTSQPLSPTITVIAQWAHRHKGHSDRDAGYQWAQQHGFPLTKADLAKATAVCSIH